MAKRALVWRMVMRRTTLYRRCWYVVYVFLWIALGSLDVNEEMDGLTYFRNASMTDTER